MKYGVRFYDKWRRIFHIEVTMRIMEEELLNLHLLSDPYKK
jgi:hypothetical protein